VCAIGVQWDGRAGQRLTIHTLDLFTVHCSKV
jgi:hypothetical protein